MSKPQLKKATITVLDGANKDKVITVLFNPTEYSFERSNSYKAMPVPGLGSPLLQFVNGESDQLSMDLFLDDYTDPDGPDVAAAEGDDPLGKRLRDLTTCSRSIATCTRRRRCASTGARWSSPRSSRSSAARSRCSIPTARRRE